MENQIVTKSLRTQLNQIIVHKQMESGTIISNNLSVDHVG